MKPEIALDIFYSQVSKSAQRKPSIYSLIIYNHCETISWLLILMYAYVTELKVLDGVGRVTDRAFLTI